MGTHTVPMSYCRMQHENSVSVPFLHDTAIPDAETLYIRRALSYTTQKVSETYHPEGPMVYTRAQKRECHAKGPMSPSHVYGQTHVFIWHEHTNVCRVTRWASGGV